MTIKVSTKGIHYTSFREIGSYLKITDWRLKRFLYIQVEKAYQKALDRLNHLNLELYQLEKSYELARDRRGRASSRHFYISN